MARIRNESSIDFNNLIGSFVEVNEEEVAYINRFASKKVIEFFLERFEDIKNMNDNDFQEEEINTNEKYKKRYQIHNKYMKKFILTDKRKRKLEFKKIIENHIENLDSIIDVSCGEDQFIFDLSREKNISLTVGNDISWSQIEMLNQKYDEVIFTNHNASSLPFKDNSFDVSYCSNTLHHMPSKKTLVNMLKSMYRVSKKLVIVEIEDPKEMGGFPLWLHKRWFVGFLKDVGGAYLTEKEFTVIINNMFEGKAKIDISNFKNIMGKYMVAKISKED